MKKRNRAACTVDGCIYDTQSILRSSSSNIVKEIFVITNFTIYTQATTKIGNIHSQLVYNNLPDFCE